MRSFLVGALAAMVLGAGVGAPAAADEIGQLMAQLPCPPLADPPALPRRRANEQDWSAASAAYNEWINQRNAALTCAVQALAAMGANETALVEEHTRLNAAGRTAQSAWQAAQPNGGRAQ
ncbi:MAG: hypothetical protein ABL883_07110 [Terricaulis sp.]